MSMTFSLLLYVNHFFRCSSLCYKRKIKKKLKNPPESHENSSSMATVTEKENQKLICMACEFLQVYASETKSG